MTCTFSIHPSCQSSPVASNTTNPVFTCSLLQMTDDVHHLLDARQAPAPLLSYEAHRDTGRPLVVEAGGWECRAGWAGASLPALHCRNLVAKTRREKGRESELLVGADISNIEVGSRPSP